MNRMVLYTLIFILVIGAGVAVFRFWPHDEGGEKRVVENPCAGLPAISTTILHHDTVAVGEIFTASLPGRDNVRWNFGELPDSMDGVSVVYKYDSVGAWTVRARSGTCLSAPLTIHVVRPSAPKPLLQPHIEGPPHNKIKVGEKLTLRETSGNAKSWHWDMGDNTTLSTQEISHVYKEAGSRKVIVVLDGNSKRQTHYDIKVVNVARVLHTEQTPQRPEPKPNKPVVVKPVVTKPSSAGATDDQVLAAIKDIRAHSGMGQADQQASQRALTTLKGYCAEGITTPVTINPGGIKKTLSALISKFGMEPNLKIKNLDVKHEDGMVSEIIVTLE